MRHVDGAIYLGAGPPSRRASSACGSASRGPLPDDQLLHRALLAYACDQVMLEPMLRRAGESVGDAGACRSPAWTTPCGGTATSASTTGSLYVQSTPERAGRARPRAPRGCSPATACSWRRSPRRAWSGSRTDARPTAPARGRRPPGETSGMVRLRRVRIDAPGWTRRRAGRGFVYLDLDRRRIADEEHLERIADARDPARVAATSGSARGRTGTSRPPGSTTPRVASTCTTSSGRAARPAQARPRARRRAAAARGPAAGAARPARSTACRATRRSRSRSGCSTSPTCASAARATRSQHGSYGLATLRREHVRVLAPERRRRPRSRAPALPRQVRAGARHGRRGRRRRDARPHAGAPPRREPRAARRGATTPGWHDVTSADVGAVRQDRLGHDATPKDFRTWHATVLAARGLADAGAPPTSERARRRAVTAGRQGGRRGAREHPGGVPRVVHRPARRRPVGARADDPARPGRRPSPSDETLGC